jgi:hypothetical protein
MALRRGLLRLWLVLSLLWIGSVAAWVGLRDPWYLALDRPSLELSSTESWFKHKYFWDSSSAFPAFNRLDVVIAHGPPAMLLLVGSGFGWAFLGFRKRT